MKQALLYSIAPQHMLNVLNGLKTIEVRKRDLPKWAKDKITRGEIVEGYGYCTKGKPYIINHPYHSYMLIADNSFDNLNGLVVVKFEVDKILTFKPIYSGGYMYMNSRDYVGTTYNNVLEKACLSTEQLEEYGNGKDLYAHHITNIQPVNMELGEFEVWYGGEESFYPLKHAPKSFQTVWVKGE